MTVFLTGMRETENVSISRGFGASVAGFHRVESSNGMFLRGSADGFERERGARAGSFSGSERLRDVLTSGFPSGHLA